jgi:acyl-CoA reductase-like NAD-dependent aldehyde dehydrogenase
LKWLPYAEATSILEPIEVTEVTLSPAIINGKAVTAEHTTEVRSPFDNTLVGLVPTLTVSDVDAAIAVAVERHHGPQLPAYERAAILDRAAVLLSG